MEVGISTRARLESVADVAVCHITAKPVFRPLALLVGAEGVLTANRRSLPLSRIILRPWENGYESWIRPH